MVEYSRLILGDRKTSFNFAEHIHKTVKNTHFVFSSIFAFHLADYDFHNQQNLKKYLKFLDLFLIELSINASVFHLWIIREILLTFERYNQLFKFHLRRCERLFHNVLITLSYLIDILTLRALVSRSKYLATN